MVDREHEAFKKRFELRMGFPFGRRARQREDIRIKNKSKKRSKKEKNGEIWTQYYDSGLHQFNDGISLTPDLFPGGSLEAYLKSRFQDTPVIGIELGGPGIRLFQDISNIVGNLKRSVGITLADPKTPRPSSHSIIEGDLNHEEVYGKIANALGGEKANLLIARPAGGIDFILNNPFFLTKQLVYLYENVLQEKSTILLQCPEKWSLFMRRWVAYANSQGLHVRYNDYALLIERDGHSPQQFPVLSASELRRAYKPSPPPKNEDKVIQNI
ncbi:MAG TPA: hypothetical protein VN711_03720 [Candidatus Saccharimonadales bacterium]|nr:hypothetical protein [Candidatus Saccharimonadales bacterium]